MDLLDVLGRYPRTNRLHTLSVPRQQQPHDVERCPPSSSLIAERVKKGTQPTLEMLLPSRSRFHAPQWSRSRAEWKEKSGEVVLGSVPDCSGTRKRARARARSRKRQRARRMADRAGWIWITSVWM